MSLLPYTQIPIIEQPNDPLVDLDQFDFVLEPVYFNRGVSTDKRMFLRQSVAQKLETIQRTILGRRRFKIWDAYRPRKVQEGIYRKLWKELAAEHPDWEEARLKIEVGVFVSPAKEPGRIPPHTTGGTADLTLVDKNGTELDMGTTVDYFGPQAAALYYEDNDISEAVRNNRRLLREAMATEEFSGDKDEWWHFDYGNQLWAYRLGKTAAIFGEAKLTIKQ